VLIINLFTFSLIDAHMTIQVVKLSVIVMLYAYHEPVMWIPSLIDNAAAYA
jgi:hypothetical protein